MTFISLSPPPPPIAEPPLSHHHLIHACVCVHHIAASALLQLSVSLCLPSLHAYISVSVFDLSFSFFKAAEAYFGEVVVVLP